MFHTRTVRTGALGAFLSGIVAMVFSASVTRAVDTQMTISTTSVDFGEVNVGNTASLAVTLTNSGSDSFGPINMFGGAPPTAEFDASQNCQGQTLAPGGSCMVTYEFSPQSPGSFTDASNFTISETANQADGEDFSVSLAGVGVNPITANPLSHDFGNVNVGTTSPNMTTVITNVSDEPFGPINMFGGAPPTAEFDASQNCQGQMLAPGGTCNVNYTFSPSAPGLFTDTSVFTISATDSQAAGVTFTVALSGCGVVAGGPCLGLVTPTPTATPTPTPTNTPTNTPTQAPAPTVPTLSFSMLALMAVALSGAALFLIKRP